MPGIKRGHAHQLYLHLYTANLLTAKIAGFHCVQIPTALSLHFLQSLNACSGSLQFYQKCSFFTATFTKFHLQSANSFTVFFGKFNCILKKTRMSNRKISFKKNYILFSTFSPKCLALSFLSRTLLLIISFADAGDRTRDDCVRVRS